MKATPKQKLPHGLFMRLFVEHNILVEIMWYRPAVNKFFSSQEIQLFCIEAKNTTRTHEEGPVGEWVFKESSLLGKRTWFGPL